MPAIPKCSTLPGGRAALLPVLSGLVLILLTTGLVRADVVELPKLLQVNQPQYDLVSQGGPLMFRMVVPLGAVRLRVETSGGRGDCDVYVRHGAHSTGSVFDKSSEGPGNEESVLVAKPAPGVWYILLQPAKAFAGVRLTVVYERDPEGPSVPRLLPGPGTYVGQARVQLKTPLVGAVVRFTTDGTNPDAGSPVYQQALVLTADTELRAQTYVGTVAHGPVVRAPYRVLPDGEITELQSGVVVPHRAGMIGSRSYFKITVPPGMERLQVATQGASGPVSVLLRHGELPSGRAFDFKDRGTTHRTVVTVDRPAEGDWYAMVWGRSNYNGLFLQAVHSTATPDLIVWPGSLQPYETTESFDAASCEVQEGMISAGTHRLLRFSTESRNVGGQAVRLGSPIGDPAFQFFECHGHYHFKGFASYVLRNKDGSIAAKGNKVSFCLEDVLRWDRLAPLKAAYDCDFQGIQAGWSDIYDSGLPGQWVDVTGLPAGDYDLEVTVNPDQGLTEGDYTNNTTVLPVTLTGG